MNQATNVLSWEELLELPQIDEDRASGKNNSHALLRLFGQPEENAQVTLYRDHHAWCPYCQKVWLWLEWKEIPYRIRKVTMRCYGKKESWYLNKVPSGLLPAIELEGKIITESDDILLSLEEKFGPLANSLLHPKTLWLRRLERRLFRQWCIWLCSPSRNNYQENERRRKNFQTILEEVENTLSKSSTPWLDPTNNNGVLSPGSGDVIFIPYLERMNASLAYYKGFCLRKEYKSINNWFSALEKDHVYRGTQGDFHTHAHDLPPQMGGCWFDNNKKQKNISNLIDIGKGLEEQEISISVKYSKESKAEALTRVLKHRESIKKVNPMGREFFDQPLRAALTNLVTNKVATPNKGSAAGLRYLRDRISVPRDMTLLAARELRQSLEQTAQIDGNEESSPIPFLNRFDQNPELFLKSIRSS
ncbi:glutathione S-transferase family protein [Prochlorococcus sp. MIT 1223]|uniref:glutathione S-transferase family protein n=1 Tax=Prochlorococcus sp. MIT 1223 TaxID=3096217 RepID=UPI002A75207F|nr:glutathione S-transferase N-terminal domain-containing protein [Prochlorococcus sp. MIT 1223]